MPTDNMACAMSMDTGVVPGGSMEAESAEVGAVAAALVAVVFATLPASTLVAPLPRCAPAMPCSSKTSSAAWGSVLCVDALCDSARAGTGASSKARCSMVEVPTRSGECDRGGASDRTPRAAAVPCASLRLLAPRL